MKGKMFRLIKILNESKKELNGIKTKVWKIIEWDMTCANGTVKFEKDVRRNERRRTILY